jgi:transcriptional regulator with AAA-type ATPase domain
MPVLTPDELAFARAVSRLAYANPFLPERIESERETLGPEFVAAGTLWDSGAEPNSSANVTRLRERSDALVRQVADRLAAGSRMEPDEVALHEDLVVYLLFARYEGDFYRLIESPRETTTSVPFYRRFARDLAQAFAHAPGASIETPHLFAGLFQIRRAFHYIFHNILGGSAPIVRLRAAVWQSIFTHDMRRYRRSLYRHMGDIATLVTGPSGTGKELVARAIGLARYIPFDADRQAFTEDFAGSFYALNLSALSPTLIESELFGHRRGAFTGALQDRAGWFEVCPPLGTVFLDEIGEVETAIQVKLLRVLQTRAFQRLGDTKDRAFRGKVIAATNRDLAVEIPAGRFRQDFYYRLCSDLIFTPSLAEQLRDLPGERRNLVLAIARRVAGTTEAEAVCEETERWIAHHLGDDYPWPGNVRELEQCVRNVMIRGEYRPPRAIAADARARLMEGVVSGALSADDLLRRYCTLVYAQTGSYQETGRRLGLDRRTVREKVDTALLAELRG